MRRRGEPPRQFSFRTAIDIHAVRIGAEDPAAEPEHFGRYEPWMLGVIDCVDSGGKAQQLPVEIG